MTWLEYLTTVLILFGALIMLYAIVYTRKVLPIVHSLAIRRTWLLLIVLMLIFFVGYLVAAGLVISNNADLIAIVTGFVFLFGAVFVTITVQTGYSTIAEIQKLYKTSEQAQRLEKAQVELINMNKQLISKNEELEQFAYMASHDLQEPLCTINSYVELLQDDYKGRFDDNADKYLQFISSASYRISELVKGLLSYALLGRNRELTMVDCNALIQDIQSNMVFRISETNTQLKIDDLPSVKGSKIELGLLFQNLLVNAIKFHKKNTTPEIKISAKKEHDFWKFSFEDNGIGIASENIEKIFVIFHRVYSKSKYEGSGIGLAHCRKIVELHGGNIWVSSHPNEGSTFSFTIPN